MEGSISTRQVCSICKGPLIHDEKRKGCFCLNHPEIAATRFIVRFPGGIYLRFKSYKKASQKLTYLRYMKGEEEMSFDPEDYRSTKPRSFIVLKDQYLERKREKGRKSIGKIESYLERAAAHFGHRIVREITGDDIETYLYGITKRDGKPISEKTRANHCSQLHDFWVFCRKKRALTWADFPEFPVIDYDLGYRKVTTWKNQEIVLNKIKERTYHINPKVWFAADLLALYTELRPEDIRRIREGDLLDDHLMIYNPTKKKNKLKVIKLHPEHIAEWKAIAEKYPALPDAYFFRHITRIANRYAGTRWGVNYLKEQWDAARDEVGLDKSISLYNGTKHTTMTETANLLGSEKANKASGLTNAAAKRYNQSVNDGAYEVVTEIMKAKKGKVLPFRKKEWKMENGSTIEFANTGEKPFRGVDE